MKRTGKPDILTTKPATTFSVLDDIKGRTDQLAQRIATSVAHIVLCCSVNIADGAAYCTSSPSISRFFSCHKTPEPRRKKRDTWILVCTINGFSSSNYSQSRRNMPNSRSRKRDRLPCWMIGLRTDRLRLPNRRALLSHQQQPWTSTNSRPWEILEVS